MSTLERTQILLEREQRVKLAEMARRSKRSVSDVVREILRERLAEEDREAKKARVRETLERLNRFCDEVQAKHGVLKVDLIEEVRRESEEDIDRMLRGE
jgi:hypothetical protein